MTEADMRQHRALLGCLIEEARERKGFTRYQIAERLDTNEQVVKDWETGIEPMDMTKLKLYCEAIELPRHEILWSFENAVLDVTGPMWAEVYGWTD